MSFFKQSIPFVIASLGALCVILIAWVVRGGIVGFRLRTYLKKNRLNRWKELTTVGSFPPGGENTYRAWKYLESNDDNDDPFIADLKRTARRAIYQSLLILGGVWLLVILLWIFAINA